MANLWKKVKHTVEQGAKTVKEGTESVAKTVGEKAPKIASSIAEKSKGIAVSVSDKTQDMVTLGQLKLKHYNLSRNISNHFTELGGNVYDLLKKNTGKDVYTDPAILKLINKVKKLENEMEILEQEMEQLHEKEAETERLDEGAQPPEEIESQPKNVK